MHCVNPNILDVPRAKRLRPCGQRRVNCGASAGPREHSKRAKQQSVAEPFEGEETLYLKPCACYSRVTSVNAFATWISLGSLVCHVCLAVFFYGRLTQKVSTQGKKLDETAAMVEKHHGEIGFLFGREGIQR